MRNVLVGFAWILASIFAACSVTLKGAAAEEGLFEEEEPEAETPASSGETIPKTREAQNLAKEVITNLNETSYSLAQSDLEGLDASFSVEQDGRSLGKLSMKWDRVQAKVTTQLQGKVPKRQQGWLRNMVEWCMRITILGWTPPEQKYPVYGAKVGDGYVLDGSADPSVKDRIMIISENYARQGDILGYDDGLVLHTEYTVEDADGKHFIKTASRTASREGTEEIRADFIFTYTRREGLVFVKRIQIEDTGPEGKSKWKLEFVTDSLAFRRPEVTKPETIIAEPEKKPEVATVTPEPEKPAPEPEKKPVVSEPPAKAEVVVPEPPAGYVKGPWGDAKVGNRLMIETVRPSPFGAVPVTVWMEVMKADEKSVTVKTTGMEGGKVRQSGESARPRFISKGEYEKLLKNEGEKQSDTTIEISDKKYKCEIYKKEVRAKDGSRVEGWTYISKEVPGWILRRGSSRAGTLWDVKQFWP